MSLEYNIRVNNSFCTYSIETHVVLLLSPYNEIYRYGRGRRAEPFGWGGARLNLPTVAISLVRITESCVM